MHFNLRRGSSRLFMRNIQQREETVVSVQQKPRRKYYRPLKYPEKDVYNSIFDMFEIAISYEFDDDAAENSERNLSVIPSGGVVF